MKLWFIVLGFAFSGTFLHAQEKYNIPNTYCPAVEGPVQTKEPYLVHQLSLVPEYPGGIKEFYSFIDKRLKKPDVDEAITVKVYLSFVIEKDGSMSAYRVLRDPGYGLGKEVLRVIMLVPYKWKPGVLNGKEVSTAYLLPIIIKLK